MPVYRYKQTGVNVSAIKQATGGTAVVGTLSPATYLDITVASGVKADLDEAMAVQGYTYDSTAPTTSTAIAAGAAQSAATPSQWAGEWAVNTTHAATYTNGLVTQELWTNTVGGLAVKRATYTYSSGRLATEVRVAYASDGTTIAAQSTYNYTYTNGRLSGTTITRDV
jgi:hypothetical protein